MDDPEEAENRRVFHLHSSSVPLHGIGGNDGVEHVT